MELNFEGLEKQEWNIPMDQAQREEEKNWVIYVVIMFTPRVMVIKMPKMAEFFVFSVDQSKKVVTVWRKY